MKFATALSLVGLGLGALAFASSQGCSSSSSTGGGSAGKVPPSPEGAPTTSTDERTYAVNELYLGDTDRSLNPNANAWKDLGYNLDGQITNASSGSSSPDLKNVCNRYSGAPAQNLDDGTDGIDNSFGHNILKLLQPFAPTPSKTISDAIKKGDFTLLLKVKGMTDDPAQSNTGLSGTLLVGASFGDTPPTFSKTDDWPYYSTPQVAINGAYITKGTFVNGQGGADVQLALSIQGQQLSLTIHKAIITFNHSAPDTLAQGTIAGVIATQEFVDGISNIAGRFSTDLCSGSTVESIKDSIRQASDMLADGSQKAGVDCTGISVGIGFSAKQVANPTKVAPEAAVPPDPCKGGGDAGTDSGGNQDQDSGTGMDAATD